MLAWTAVVIAFDWNMQWVSGNDLNCVGSGNCFELYLKRNRKLCCEFVFMFFFDRSLNSFAVSQAGQVWLTLFGSLQLFVKPGTDAEKVYWTLRQVGTLELLSDWLDFVWRQLECKHSPFGLEQSYRTSLDGWTSTEVSANQFWLWDELYGLYSNDCQCGLPTMVVAFPLVEM